MNRSAQRLKMDHDRKEHMSRNPKAKKCIQVFKAHTHTFSQAYTEKQRGSASFTTIWSQDPCKINLCWSLWPFLICQICLSRIHTYKIRTHTHTQRKTHRKTCTVSSFRPTGPGSVQQHWSSSNLMTVYIIYHIFATDDFILTLSYLCRNM